MNCIFDITVLENNETVMIMKLKNKMLLTMGSVGAVAAVTAAASLGMKVFSGDAVLPAGFTLTAHTGCDGTADNSLDSITVGYVSGADAVEFDLSFNNDGVAVLSHDEPVGGEVTLDEAFSHLKQFKNLLINVDVKRTDDLKQVAECAKKHGVFDRMFYTGITCEDVEAVISNTPDVPYYLNVSVPAGKGNDTQYISELIEEVKTLGAIGLNFRYTSCSKKLVDMFHEQGLLVSIWTVNNRFDMKKALSYGADNVTTKKPSVYSQILEAYLPQEVEKYVITE